MIGSYIAARPPFDFVRSHALGFIFTTSLPPALAAASPASGIYCGLLVVVELVVLPPLLGSISVFEWVSELPAEPCL